MTNTQLKRSSTFVSCLMYKSNLDGIVEGVLDGGGVPLVDADRLQLLHGPRRRRRILREKGPPIKM